MGQSTAASARFVRFGAIAIFLALIFIAGTSRAEAATFVSGQQEVWPAKERGTAKNELFNPGMLGVDSSDGSVYIGDESADGSTERIQKFSEGGQFEAMTGTLPSGVIGIAVDAQRKRFYVLETSEGTGPFNEVPLGAKILVFKTEQNGEVLEELPELTLPAQGSEALVSPREIAVDPSNGDLVVLAKDEAEHVILEMVNSQTGASMGRYTETGSLIFSEELGYGMAVDQQGITYLVTGGEEGLNQIRAYTLPANFRAPLALTPVPGIEDSVTSEEWPGSNPEWVFMAKPFVAGNPRGPQVAVDSTPTGDVLYYKTSGFVPGAREAGKYFVHGYSVAGEATAVVFGGSETEGECAIQTQTAAFGVGKDGSLVVLDQGPFSGPGIIPFGPNVMRFGPGAESAACPVPAAALELKLNGSTVGSVESGKTVTLDASNSELGGQTLSEMTWVVEGPGGSVFEESKPAPTESISHEFTTPGTYTVRLKMKTSVAEALGNTVSTARTLEVTASGTPAPVVTGISPTKGPAASGTTVTITGEHLTGATEVKFGSNPATNVVVVSDTQITAVSPAGTAGSKVNVTVVTPGGPSGSVPADEFEYEHSVTPAPVVTAISPTKGPAAGGTTVTITGEHLTGATEVKFGSNAATNVVVVGEHEITAKSPAGTAGSKVNVTVVTPGGPSGSVPADEFEYEHSVTPAPVVTAISPTKGLAAGGTTVTITGQHLTGATGIKFGANAATNVVVVSDTQVTAVSPAGTAGTKAAVTVVTSGGTSGHVAADEFEYEATSGGGGGGGTGGGGSSGGGGGTSGGGTPGGGGGKSNVVKPGAAKSAGASASLTVTVPGPGTLAASGKGIATTKVKAKGAGPVRLKLKVTGAAKKTLTKTGKVTVKVKIVFTPTGGTPGMTTKTITFKAKKKH